MAGSKSDLGLLTSMTFNPRNGISRYMAATVDAKDSLSTFKPSSTLVKYTSDRRRRVLTGASAGPDRAVTVAERRSTGTRPVCITISVAYLTVN